MTLIARLQDVDATRLADVGGKAANLGEMLRAGLPIPPGFVLITAAYRLFVAAAGLEPAIDRLARSAHPEDAPALEAASSAIAALFADADMPDAIADDLRSAYQHLGQPVVAVRSSATAEDLPVASFAGQMDSFLGISGEQALLAAVRRCWASLWTARALSYRTRQGIPHEAVHLAVVVQQIV